MVRTTKAQRRALKRVYDRAPPKPFLTSAEVEQGIVAYRQFRRSVQPYFGGDGCILVPWCSMWLGIEPDGYTHS